MGASKPVVVRAPGKAAVKPVPTKPVPPVTLPSATPTKTNPLLPSQIGIEVFYADLSLSAKLPAMTPAGIESAYSGADWKLFREKFGVESDGLAKLKPSGQIAFAGKLIDAATGDESSSMTSGYKRLLLMRAGAIAYRTKDGFPTADKAVQAYMGVMDKKSPAQVGVLWTLANIMSRTAVTPKPDRIRYDGVAARANMQLALLMIEIDQLDASQAIIKQVAYHEGWLKADPATRAQIAHVRSEVKQRAAMMDYLATQYQPAIKNDVPALTAIYLYGRFVKENIGLVVDLPGRVPESALGILSRKLDAAAHGDMDATYAAAESLRFIAAGTGDACMRSRILYAALQLYDAYMAAPSTERNRVQRTLARINRQAVVSEGARRGTAIDPFAPRVDPAAVLPEAASREGVPLSSR